MIVCINFIIYVHKHFKFGPSNVPYATSATSHIQYVNSKAANVLEVETHTVTPGSIRDLITTLEAFFCCF